MVQYSSGMFNPTSNRPCINNLPSCSGTDALSSFPGCVGLAVGQQPGDGVLTHKVLPPETSHGDERHVERCERLQGKLNEYCCHVPTVL